MMKDMYKCFVLYECFKACSHLLSENRRSKRPAVFKVQFEPSKGVLKRIPMLAPL